MPWASSEHIRLHDGCRDKLCGLLDSGLTPFLRMTETCKTPRIYISSSKLWLSFENQLLDRAWAPAMLTCAHRGPYWSVCHAAYIFSRKKVNVLFLLLNSQSGSCKGPIKLVLTNYFVVKAVTSSRSLSFIAARFHTRTVILVYKDSFSHHTVKAFALPTLTCNFLPVAKLSYIWNVYWVIRLLHSPEQLPCDNVTSQKSYFYTSTQHVVTM